MGRSAEAALGGERAEADRGAAVDRGRGCRAGVEGRAVVASVGEGWAEEEPVEAATEGVEQGGAGAVAGSAGGVETAGASVAAMDSVEVARAVVAMAVVGGEDLSVAAAVSAAVGVEASEWATVVSVEAVAEQASWGVGTAGEGRRFAAAPSTCPASTDRTALAPPRATRGRVRESLRVR